MHMRLLPGLSHADQLQRAVERGEYAEAARLLEAVQQLAAHFRAFGSIPKVGQPSDKQGPLVLMVLQRTRYRGSAGYCAQRMPTGAHVCPGLSLAVRARWQS